VLADSLPDVYVLLVNHMTTGVKPQILCVVKLLRDKLLQHETMTTRIHGIEFLRLDCARVAS
jgi:hypothetical protein